MIVAHLDLDAFFAAVEELERPELAEVRSSSAVTRTAAASSPRRTTVRGAYGIHSAMSCAEALRRCPHAVFIRPSHRRYSEYSRTVWTAVREVVPTVERTGLDEGYLDMAEAARDFRQARLLAEAVQAAVRGATVSRARSASRRCKVVAKVASDRRKPGGITVVPPGREAAFLAPFPVRLLPGVGPRAEERLRAAGIEPIGGARRARGRRARPLLPGKVGRLLRDRARGIDPRPLEHAAESVSIGHEETFERDVSDRAQLHAELRRMALSVADQLAGVGPGGAHGDDEAPLPGLLHPQPLDDPRAGARTASRSASSPASPRPGARRPPQRAAPGRRSVSNLEPFQQLALEASRSRQEAHGRAARHSEWRTSLCVETTAV